VLAADRVVIEQKRMGDFLTAPPLAQKHQGIRTPRHPATRRRIARQRRKRLANFFAEDARLNPARNRIRPIGNRKNSVLLLRIDRAANVATIAPAGLSANDLLSRGRPAQGRPCFIRGAQGACTLK
jgi:hypothetical protein